MAFRLHRTTAEVFVGTLSRIGLAVVIPLLIIGALFTPELARSSRIDVSAPVPTQTNVAATTDDVTNEASAQETSPDADGPVDLYGNEVTDAIAEYKFDATGSLYETHSPQTELPRLGSPKS
jgi:hypothetical protein